MRVGESYRYDNRNRLLEWTKEEVNGSTVETYGFDSLGNLIEHAGDIQSFSNPERPHAIKSRANGSVLYDYDPDGNVKSITGGGANRFFNFNSANQLVCIGSGESAPGESLCDQNVFRYDIHGTRLIDIRGLLDYQVFVDPTYSYDRYPAKVSATVEVIAFGERIANKEIPAVRLRTASGLPVAFDDRMVAGAALLALAGLLAWGARLSLIHI